MRKFSDEDVINEMDRINSGELTQRDLAKRLGVTPSALNQRIQRLRACTPPESFKDLTERQRRFVVEKVSGKSNLQAVKSAGYDVSSDQSGKSIATVLMRDPDINLAINDLMAQVGIPKRRRIERLKDLIECRDLSIAGRGLDMSFKLGGDYSPQVVEVITDIELRALIAHFAEKKPPETIGDGTVTESD